MEQLIFWGKFLGSIILIIAVLLILGHFYIEIKVYGVARTWERFKIEFKARIDGSKRKERIEREKREYIYKQEEAVRQKIEDKKKAVQRKIEEEKKKAHQQMIQNAGGWEKYSELLKNEYEKEKAELSIEKNIKCDDGVIRIYKEEMRGIISEYTERDLSIFIYKSRAPHNIRHTIDRIKCFSKDGKTLNCDEITSNYKHKRQLDDKFDKKYKEIIPRHRYQISIRQKSPDAKEYLHLYCINGIFFYSDKTPFSGEILFKKKSEGIIIKDGYILDSTGEKKTLNEIKLDFFTREDIDNVWEVENKFNECFFSSSLGFIDGSFETFDTRISNFYKYYDKIQDGLE